MKIVVTGATGFLGRRLTGALQARGHQVHALGRSAQRTAAALPGATAFGWDPLAGPPPPEALAGVDAVVHLAGESVQGRWTAAKRASIADSRSLGTRHLVDGLAATAPHAPALVSASAIGYYGDRGDEQLPETAGPGDDFLARVCVDWEREAERAREVGARVTQVRLGIVLGDGGGALAAMLPLFRKGLGGALGPGRQWWSWIHADDAVALFVAAAVGALRGPAGDETLDGALNAVAPGAVRQREFARALGRALRRPAVLPAPAFAIRAALGGFAVELLSSKHVIPRAALDARHRFLFPEVDGALADLVGRIDAARG